ncbi:MAG: Coenzyme F420 hydrogenase/dehydrogenase, beta subunit C-terminal domain [Longimicrobiales bacterium]|nr:Coenzyme F420 hydrogenase/dehydrogenase, beta subunit C-terminal domain [Longimicrobiales bacterium]
MSVPADLSGVIDAEMCIGCGACVFADPSLDLILDPQSLVYRPSHAGNAAAAAVCPAVEVDFAELHRRRFPGVEVGPYGVVEAVHLAQSVDPDRNRRASSGGLIKELLIELLGREDVDGAIALSHVGGLDFQPRMIRTAEEVDTLPGSIYHALAQPRTIELLRENPGRFVVVAIPCQLEGIWKYIDAHEPRLAKRIHSTIGLICGWQYSHHALRAICDYEGVDPERIVDLSYRGDGPVGKLRLTLDDGSEVTASRRTHFGYQVAFDRHFNTPRCHLCVNHSNYLADLVVGDAWLPSTVFTRTGISLVISRTPRARALVEGLAADGRIVSTEVSEEEIRESQKDRVVFGDFAYAYAEYLDELGIHRPRMSGPNRERATPASRGEVEHFHRERMRKRELQRAGRYRRLRWRKATVELRSFLARYWRWFAVRILRIKSLTGEREELPREVMKRFR